MSSSIKIKGIGRYIPEKVVDNKFFIDHFHKEEWGNKEVGGLLDKLGRKERHFCTKEENSLTMGIEASKDVLERIDDITATDIDMIVFVSDTPEYNMPTNAILIGKEIGASNANIVFDMNCNCVGMIVALDNVCSFMKTHDSIKNALVVGSVHFSSIVRFDDTVTYPNFGDGSSAVILSKSEEENVGIIASKYKSDTAYSNYVRFPSCGHSNSLLGKQHKYYRRLEWNPFNSSFFADWFSELITQLFEDYGISDKDIAYYAFSQLSDSDNKRTLNMLNAVIDERYLYNGDKFGYTGCNSPIIALSDVWGSIQDYKGKYVIIISVGAGASMSALLYKI